MLKENIEDWQPYYLSYKIKDIPNSPRKVYYQRSWFCNENVIIHHSEKEVLNCNHCSKKYYKL